MSLKLRERATYANVVSTLCLFLVLAGGTAWAAATITGADVVDESLTGADVKQASIFATDIANETLTGTDIAPSSINGSKIIDGSLVSGDIDDGTVTGTDIANQTITGAFDIAGSTISKYNMMSASIGEREIIDASILAKDLAPPEPWRRVGVSGQPPWSTRACGSFTCEWKSDTSDGDAAVAFAKDQLGVVRLKGHACHAPRIAGSPVGSGGCQTGDSMPASNLFVLPVGYRPVGRRAFPVPGYSDIVKLFVEPTGVVWVQGTAEGEVYLDAVSFRLD